VKKSFGGQNEGGKVVFGIEKGPKYGRVHFQSIVRNRGRIHAPSKTVSDISDNVPGGLGRNG